MPLFHRNLSGYESGLSVVAVFQNLEQSPPLFIHQWHGSPVIQNQKIKLGQVGKELQILSVHPGDSQFLKEPWKPQVQNPMAFPAKPAVKGNYSEYDDCVYYLPVGQTCTMTVTFTPESAGFAPGLITIYVQAGTSLTGYSYPQYVYLLGAGQ